MLPLIILIYFLSFFGRFLSYCICHSLLTNAAAIYEIFMKINALVVCFCDMLCSGISVGTSLPVCSCTYFDDVVWCYGDGRL